MSNSCDPTDCSPPGSSVRGISQARILEWLAISFSRDLPDPGIEPGSPALQADALPTELAGKLQSSNREDDKSQQAENGGKEINKKSIDIILKKGEMT